MEGVRWSSTVTNPAQYTNSESFFSWGTGRVLLLPVLDTSKYQQLHRTNKAVLVYCDSLIFDEAVGQCQLSHQTRWLWELRLPDSTLQDLSANLPWKVGASSLEGCFVWPRKVSALTTLTWHPHRDSTKHQGNTEGNHDHLSVTPPSLESHGKRNATWAPSLQASSWSMSWLGMAAAARSPQHCSPFPYLGHSPLLICPWAPCSAWTAKNQPCLSGVFKASFLCSPVFLLRREPTAPSRFLRTCCTPNAEGTQRGMGLCWRECWSLGTATAALTKRDYVSEIFLLNIPQPDLSQLRFYFLMLPFQTWALIYRFRDFDSSLFWYEAPKTAVNRLSSCSKYLALGHEH